MVTLRSATSELATTALCGILSAGDVAADYLNSAVSSLPGVGKPYDPKVNDGFKGMVCPDEPKPFTVIPPAPPFPGGQCVTLYRVDGVGSYFASSVNDRRTITFGRQILRGPITNPSVVQDGEDIRWFVTATSTQTGLRQAFQLGSVGTSIGTVSDGAFASLVVGRNDGLPDNCGSLPAEGPIKGTGNVTYDSDGTDITVPVNVVFLPPIIGPNGDISFPFEFEGPGFSLKPTFNFNDNSVAFNLPSGSGTGGGCDPMTDPPVLPPAPGEPPGKSERYFRALVVVSTGDFNTTTVTQKSAGNGVDLFIPRLGTVSIKIPLGESFAWLPDISIKHRRQIIIIPENFVGSGYAAQPIVGVNFELIPIYLRNYNAPDQ